MFQQFSEQVFQLFSMINVPIVTVSEKYIRTSSKENALIFLKEKCSNSSWKKIPIVLPKVIWEKWEKWKNEKNVLTVLWEKYSNSSLGKMF